jgi:uncharacterized protein YbjT (DUF2867 family)
MKIVIIGGSGLIGSKVTSKLRQLGHDVLAASPDTGVNTITGEGLADALKGAEVVIDVANSPSFEDKAVLEFFETSGRNLLAMGASTGVKHHVALSVVGTDRLQESGYFRGKQAQENLIRKSGLAYTIVHSTQFFEFLGGIVASAAKGQEIHLSPAEIQPISSDDVADAMVDAALGKPVNGILEIAGPEIFSLADLVQRYLEKTQDARQVKADPQARYFGALLQTKTLVPAGKARPGKINFETWIKAKLQKA